jgi:hypothetical protein
MLRIWIVVFSALVVGTLSGIPNLEASPQSSIISPESGKHFERVVLKYLWPALDYGQTVGRIYYGAICKPNANSTSLFPNLDVRPPPDGKIGVAAVRDIFRHVKDISVKETVPGIIRVRIGNVSDAIMHVRIANLVLEPTEQYNYWLAIFKIENAPEVRSAMQELKIRLPVRPVSIGIAQPAEGLPHLPGVITNITVDQALDLVAKTFRGVVVYEFCTSPDQYEIRFANDSDIYSTLNE